MRMLVISDTHGYLEAARLVIIERGPWDQIVHLGDSLQDVVDLAAELQVNITAVPGNNEYPGAGPGADEKALVFELEGFRFYALHGHEMDVNPYAGEDIFQAALREIANRAKFARAQVALFGHTHQPLLRDQDGILLVNPGAIGLGDQKKSYADLSLIPGRLEVRILDYENNREIFATTIRSLL